MSCIVRLGATARRLGLSAGLLWFAATATAGSVRHYDIDAELQPSRGRLRATAALTLTAPEEGLQRIELLLNHGLSVQSVACDEGVKSFQFDRSEKTSYRYAPTAAPLRIELATPLAAGRSVVIQVRYEGSIDPDPWLTNVLTADWVELAQYSAWYPFVLDRSGGFTYALRLRPEPGYTIAGPGAVAQSEGTTTLTQDRPNWDIVFAAARGLRARHVDAGGAAIDVWNVDTSPVDAKVERFAADMGRMSSQMRGWFGTLASDKMTIVFAERKSGGGYYRPGFISLLFDQDERGLIKYAAHELGHFWWGRGDSTTWQDWLNESFAEYSSLMLMREWYGRETFASTLADYTRQAEKTPAIWGLDRNHESAYAVLYRRGPVLLARLEQRIGHEPFRHLLAALVERKVRTTEDFLSTLGEISSRAVADDFALQLKTP